MPKALDLSGQRFGNLIAVRQGRKPNGALAWECVCDCGGASTVLTVMLRNGHSKTCGCKGRGISKPEVTAEYIRSILDYDQASGILTWKPGRPWVSGEAGYDEDGYIGISIDGRKYRAHNLAWLYVYGEWPSEIIDHRDRDRKNNRLDNLRISGKSKNGMNRPKPSNNKSGYKGVYWWSVTGKWVAKITHGGRHEYLGYFDCPKEAALAYDQAAESCHGEFAYFNLRENRLCRK